jgi:hypothetical protein
MKKTLLIALAMTASLMACPQGSCAAGGSCPTAYRSGGVLDTLTYALGVMKLQDDPEIKRATQGYKMHLCNLPCGVDTEAFIGGKFNKTVYVENSALTKKVQAQAELFETLYRVLDDKQKVRLHQLMAAHQHYVDTLEKENPSACKGGKACPVKPSKSEK